MPSRAGRRVGDTLSRRLSPSRKYRMTIRPNDDDSGEGTGIGDPAMIKA
jgi:hypothetical protein